MSDKSLEISKEDRRAFWDMHVQRWRESNMTQEAYCNQAGINYSSFVSWKSALTPKPKIEKNKAFVPVTIDAAQTATVTQSQHIQIKLTTGHIVYIPITMDPKQIASLIYSLSTPHA